MKRLLFIFMIPIFCYADQIISTVVLPHPTIITNTESYVTISDCEQEYDSGKPNLPFNIFSLEISNDDVVKDVKIESEDLYTLHDIPKIGTVQSPISDNVIPEHVDPNYDFSTYYPESILRTYAVNKINDQRKVFIFFYPVSYNRSLNSLKYSTKFKITIDTEKGPLLKSNLKSYTILNQETNRYVIISTNSLYTYNGEYSIQSLLDYRYRQGFTTKYVPVEWIYENYDGRDPQEKIRHFCQEAYLNWNAEFLLLIGDDSIIPLRCFFVENTPSDNVYYGCLDGTMDYDNDNIFGELYDGENGAKKCDVSAELKVGRFPVYTTNQLANVIRKTILREQNSYIRDHGLIGEDLNPLYSSTFMETYLKRPNIGNGQSTVGYLTSIYSNDFNVSTLYDTPEWTFKAIDVINFFNRNMSYVAHIGHGSSLSCFKSYWPSSSGSLTNTIYPIIYSIACNVGGMDLTTKDCVAQSLLFDQCGPAAVCMNTRYGWYSFTGQPQYSLDQIRMFTDNILRGNLYLGDVFKNTMDRSGIISLSTIGFSTNDKVFYAPMLFGDPASPVFPSVYKNKITISNINISQTSNTVSMVFELSPAGYYNPDIELLWQNQRIDVIRTNNHYEATINVNERIKYQEYNILALGLNNELTTSNKVAIIGNVNTNYHAVLEFSEILPNENSKNFLIKNLGIEPTRVKIVITPTSHKPNPHEDYFIQTFTLQPHSGIIFLTHMIYPYENNKFWYTNFNSEADNVFILNVYDSFDNLNFSIESDDYYSTTTNVIHRNKNKIKNR